MASNCHFNEDSGSSRTGEEMTTNETALPVKLESQTASTLVRDEESGSSDDSSEEMEANEIALPRSSSCMAFVELLPRKVRGEGSSSSSSNDSSEKMIFEIDLPGSSNAEEEKYKCPQYPKQNKTKRPVSSLMKIHDKNQRIQCEVCEDKFFATKREYNRHMRSHTGEKLQCPTCSRCFGRLYNLREHQYLHLDEKTFKCPECPVDRYFQSPGQLRSHMVIHKKEKRHKCSICRKEFHRISQLKQHESVHTKVKPYQCGICSKRFCISHQLKRHLGTHFPDKRPYKCDSCDVGFNDASNCKRHMKTCATTVEKREYKCPECPKRYTMRRNMNRHMKIHNKETTN